MLINNIAMFWLGLVMLFVILEAAVPGLICIWFAIGSVAALLAEEFGAGMVVQCVVFVAVSILTLIFTKPYADRFVNARAQKTNADMIIGKNAVVTEDINNMEGKGMVAVDGKSWTARSSDGDPVPAGSVVKVVRIDGVKAVVESNNFLTESSEL